MDIRLPDPVEAITFRMEQMGLSPKDLEPMIGGGDVIRRSICMAPGKGVSVRYHKWYHHWG